MLALVLAISVVAGLESDPEFKKGQEQVDAFDYEKAALTFDSVAKRPGLPPSDKAVALVWLGLSYAELRDQARASLAFEDAVSADPLVGLPRDVSPKIKALLDDARARVRARPKDATTTVPTLIPDNTTGNGTVDNNGSNGTGSDVKPTPASPDSPLMPVAIGTVVAGGVVTLAGAAVWAVGLGLRQKAIDAPFQSDAASFRDQSIGAQIGGQITAGVGVAALAAGGVLFAVSGNNGAE